MYVFLIFGAFSIVTGVFALWLLPDLPSTAKFLTERQRAIAVDRVAVNRQGVKNHQFKWYQVWQATRDPKSWLLFVMAIGAQVPNSALTSVSRKYCMGFVSDIQSTDGMDSSLPSSSVLSASILSELNTYKSQAAQFNS